MSPAWHWISKTLNAQVENLSTLIHGQEQQTDNLM